MASVVRNPDNTVTITFVAWEQRVLVRWAQDNGRTVANQVEDVFNGFLVNKRSDYLQADGPTMRERYEALSAAKQAEIDAILNS
jgi:hypothetical protein